MKSEPYTKMNNTLRKRYQSKSGGKPPFPTCEAGSMEVKVCYL